MVSFAVQNLLSWIRSHFKVFVFIFIRRWVKKDISVIYVSVLPMFSPKSFIVSGLTFRFLMNFEFIFELKIVLILFFYT